MKTTIRHFCVGISALACVLIALNCSSGGSPPLPDAGVDAGACSLSPGDGGACTSDGQCQPGQYCDFSLEFCSAALNYSTGIIVPGVCQPICSGGGRCGIGEECPQSSLCIGPLGLDDVCTLSHPCLDGGSCEHQPCGMPPVCSGSCRLVEAPHSCDKICVCGSSCAGDGGR